MSTPNAPGTRRKRLSKPAAQTVSSDAQPIAKADRGHVSQRKLSDAAGDGNSATPVSIHTRATSLYTVVDDRGEKSPTPAYNRWLATLPVPMSPAQRYRDELRAYPTAISRSARTTPGGIPDGGEPMIVDVVDGSQSHVRPISSALDKPEGPHQFYCPGRRATPDQQQKVPSACPQALQEKKSLNKLKKKRPLQLHQEDQRNKESQQDQPSPAKKGRFGTLARTLSRLGGRHSPGHGQDPRDPDQARPGTSLSRTLSVSRRRISGFFRSSTAEPYDRSSTPSGAIGPNGGERRRRSFYGFRAAGGGPTYVKSGDLLTHQLAASPELPRILGAKDLDTGDYRMQIALVGDATVGKTALVKRFITGEAVDAAYAPTPTRDVHKVLMSNCLNGFSCRVEIHDCGGGQEETDISHLTRNWWDAIVLCFSVGDPATLAACTKRWIDDARANTAGVPIFLAGLKSDRRGPALQLAFLLDDQVVTRYHAEEAARQISARGYLECSAKDNKGVPELFYSVINASLPRVVENERRAEAATFNRKRHEIIYGIRSLLHPSSRRGEGAIDGHGSSSGHQRHPNSSLKKENISGEGVSILARKRPFSAETNYDGRTDSPEEGTVRVKKAHL